MPEDKKQEVKTSSDSQQDKDAVASIARREKFVTDMTALLKAQATVDTVKAAAAALQQEMATVHEQIRDLQYAISKVGQDMVAMVEGKK